MTFPAASIGMSTYVNVSTELLLTDNKWLKAWIDREERKHVVDIDTPLMKNGRPSGKWYGRFLLGNSFTLEIIGKCPDRTSIVFLKSNGLVLYYDMPKIYRCVNSMTAYIKYLLSWTRCGWTIFSFPPQWVHRCHYGTSFIWWRTGWNIDLFNIESASSWCV